MIYQETDDMLTEEELMEEPSEEEPNVTEDKMTDDDLLQIVKSQMADALGNTDDLDGLRSDALSYYFNKPRGDEIKGRSSAQSSDVADMINAIMAQIMPSFDSDCIVEFTGYGEEDEASADAETLYVNHQVMDLNNGYSLFQTAFQDALLMKNCFFKVYVDEQVDVRTFDYQGLSQSELAQIMQPQSPDEFVDVEESPSQAGSNVVPFSPEHSVSVKRIRKKKKLVVMVVPPEEFSFSGSHMSIDLTDIQFCNHRLFMSRSDLIASGYNEDDVMRIPSSYANTKTTSHERNQVNNEVDEFYNNPHNKMAELVWVNESYVKADYNGDGYAELRKVVTGSETSSILLENIEVPFHPFAAGTGFLLPHRVLGQSVYDKQKQTQDNKTFILRQWLDNLNVMNNRRIAADIRRVDVDSLLESRPGGVVEVNGIPGDNLFPIPVDDIGPSCQMALDYQDKIRTERGGASLDLQSDAVPVAAETAHGVERQYSSKELIAAQVSRTLAETGIRSMFILVHNTLREYMPEAAKAKIGNKYVQVQPATWPERDQIRLTIGLSPAEKSSKQAVLQSLLANAKELMMQGSTLVTNQNIYDLTMELSRLSDISTPSRFMVDPKSQEGQQATQQQQQQQQQMAQKQAEVEQVQMQLQVAISESEKLKAQSAAQKVKYQGMIDGLQLQLDQATEIANASQKSDDLKFEYDKLYTELALRLTELEQEKNQQLNAEVQNNVME